MAEFKVKSIPPSKKAVVTLTPNDKSGLDGEKNGNDYGFSRNTCS